jgi:Uri superfamily endonuclease
MQTRPGTYILLLTLKKTKDITIGKLGTITFPAESYVYIGSAQNGLDQRIHRHQRATKKTHWHIDYLLPHTHINHIYIKPGTTRNECSLATAFHHYQPIPGFGSSDCTCTTHLYHGTLHDLTATIQHLGLTPYIEKIL